MKSIQVNKDGALDCMEQEKDRERNIWGERERSTTERGKGMGKWRWLILTIGLNKTTPENVYRRSQSKRTINLMKIVNQHLWLGISSASNGAKC
jgi:hypothetical protein